MNNKCLFHYFILSLLLCSIFTFHAKGQDVLNKTFMVNLEKVKIENAIKTISTLTNVKFNYSSGLLKLSTIVSYHSMNKNISDFINTILIPNGISYQLVNGTIVLFPTKKNVSINLINSDPFKVNSNTVSGIVKDSTGLPLEGVTITEKGTTNKVITNKMGEFVIHVKNENAKLVVTHIGYKTIEKRVDDNIDIVMYPIVNKLDDVIVIGYGTVKKSDLTGSITKLKTDGVENTPTTSFEQFIQGRVAGVQITQNSGALAGGMTFLIRGANSISGSNSPLIVVDGYPISSGSVTPTTGLSSDLVNLATENSLASLNPNDIESIEILKDASATAIYGSRGANGVVIISTKRGVVGKDNITYSFREDFSNIVKKQINVLSSKDYLSYSNEAFSDINNGYIAYNQGNYNTLNGFENNWQNSLIQTGIAQSHQLKFTAGDDKLRYSLSLGYLNQTGVILTSLYQRGTVRLNVDRKVNKSFSYGVNINSTMSLNHGVNENKIISQALLTPPINKPFSQDSVANLNYGIDNPMQNILYGNDENRVVLMNGAFFSDLKITKDLKCNFRTGINSSSSLRNLYLPTGTAGSNRHGYAYQGNASSVNYLTESTLSYNKTWGKSRFTALTGYTWQHFIDRKSGSGAANFTNDRLSYTNIGVGTIDDKPSNSIVESALASFIFRTNYIYNDRYIFTLTGRYDGTSRFSEGNKWGFFPAVAAAWNVDRESFMKIFPVVSLLKLRTSYGISGNQSVNVGSSISQLAYNNSVINNNIITAFGPLNIANNNLGWEYTGIYNLGMDMGILNGRYSLTVETYNKRTSNLLVSLIIPGTTGFTSYSTNAGEVENKGIEISTMCQVLTKKLRWNVGGNISFNRNKVISFNNIVPNVLGATSLNSQSLNIATPGFAIGSFYGYRVSGIYQTQAEIDNSPGVSINAKPGFFKIADLNKDGLISASDRTIIGNPFPKYFFGITNDFFWKSFSLNVLIQGSVGHQVANVNRYYLDGLSRSTNKNISAEAYQNRWTGPGTSNTYPIAQSGGTPFYGFFTDFIIEDASYLRLKSVTVSYQFKIKKSPILNSINCFVTGTNLLTLTNYKGYDPEVNSAAANPLTQGQDNGVIPQNRTFSTGINVSF